MVDYEKISALEVQRLARQGDKEALFEMAWRFELLPASDRNDPVESCAWQDYWLEKAAEAGHIDAKSQYACSLINRLMNAENRQKAMYLFESLAADFDANKLSKDKEIYGITSKLWLGIMLCQGYHTRRDAIKGAELIQTADALTNGFEKFGYRVLSKIGEIYTTGLAQPGEEPSIADLEKAIKYQDAAVKRFVQEDDDPNNRGYLQLTKDMLERNKKWIVTKTELRDFHGRENLYFSGADERRKKMMEIPDAGERRMEADKTALARLRQRLAREGW